jgi:hypothetical protein
MIAPTLQHIIRARSNIRTVSTLRTSDHYLARFSYVIDIGDHKDYLLLGSGNV